MAQAETLNQIFIIMLELLIQIYSNMIVFLNPFQKLLNLTHSRSIFTKEPNVKFY